MSSLDKVISIKNVTDLEAKVAKSVDNSLEQIDGMGLTPEEEAEWKSDLTSFIIMQLKKETTLRALFDELADIIDEKEVRNSICEQISLELNPSSKPSSTISSSTSASSSKSSSDSTKAKRVIAPMTIGRVGGDKPAPTAAASVPASKGPPPKASGGGDDMDKSDAARAARLAKFGAVATPKVSDSHDSKQNSSNIGGKRTLDNGNKNSNSYNSNSNNNSNSNSKFNRNESQKNYDGKKTRHEYEAPAPPPIAPPPPAAVPPGYMMMDPKNLMMMMMQMQQFVQTGGAVANPRPQPKSLAFKPKTHSIVCTACGESVPPTEQWDIHNGKCAASKKEETAKPKRLKELVGATNERPKVIKKMEWVNEDAI